MPRLEHIPSYAQHEPVLQSAPQASPNLSVPSSAAIGQMPSPRTGPLTLAPSRKTTVLFGDGNLAQPVLPEFAFHLARADAPANASFRVAVDHAGALRYCFLTESSGDPALDEQARQFLILCRFPPKTEPPGHELIWSNATVLWGNDFAPLPSPKP